MKKIIINGESLTSPELYGVHRNALELIAQVDHLAPQNAIELVVPGNINHSLSFKNIQVVNLTKSEGVFGRLKWNQFDYPRYVKKNKAIGVDLTLRLPLWSCDIVEIHDCIVEDFPANANTIRKKLGRLFYIIRAKSAISRGATIITNSAFSRKQISDHYKIGEKDITVIPCAWQHYEKIEADEEVLGKFDLQDKGYFFTLGSRFAHKNFRWIVEAARQNPNWQFVISGTSLLSTSDKSIEKDNPANLLFTGYLNDSEVKGLMKHCRAYIQPSLCEGFGIPPIEAMSTGAKCIISHAGSFPEIYEDSVWYIDPEQYDSINIDQIINQPIEENGKILSKFSWEKSAAKLWEILQKEASRE